ncbi:MAG: beta-lactamase family protein [Spirochaetaceae bacterium]|jgi:CubicO group peptidase (beta-lactamase class C family)|nr:beta-lactamase family protein [Spirochaetaceae bacterium]
MKRRSGFSPARLRYVDEYFQRLTDTGEVAGAGGLIIRHGVLAYRKSFGMQDLAERIPMRNDSIYRIYSMTKTFTIVAGMTLYERGFFKLQDPISEFLPAFASMQVARHDPRGVVSLRPAEGPITFQHLFTMTSGLPYPGNDSYSARLLGEIQSAASSGPPPAAAELVDAAARGPLCFQPGEHWMYGFSHDVLGRLIEVISGQRLGAYMAETIFEPLGLRDTQFYVPTEKRSRLTKVYAPTETGLKEVRGFTSDPGSTAVPPAFESGGGGLASTLDDIGRYGLMLLRNGKLGGTRILSRKTIALIRQNQVSTDQIKRFGFPSMTGYGYGLGVRTLLDPGAAGLNGSIGEWAWDGMLGTWYCVDPQEDLVAVFLVQRQPGGNEDLPKRFAQTVYAAIDD